GLALSNDINNFTDSEFGLPQEQQQAQAGLIACRAQHGNQLVHGLSLRRLQGRLPYRSHYIKKSLYSNTVMKVRGRAGLAAAAPVHGLTAGQPFFGQNSMRKGNYLFTSESVSEGHPDKV